MDFRKINTFLLLAKRLNYSQTAQELYLSQSAVSQHIKSLEAELGFMLFERNRVKVQLTPEGEIMAKTFNGMMKQYEKGLQEIRTASNDKSILNVGYPSSLYWMNMPKFINSFKQRHAVDIQVSTICGEKDVQPFLDGYTDVLFSNILRIEKLNDCDYTPVLRVGFNVVMTAEHPLSNKEKLTPQDLYPYIVYCAGGTSEDICLARLNRIIASCGIDPTKMRLAPHREDVIYSVAMNYGVGLVPDNAPFGEGGDLISIPFDAADVAMEYACAVHKDAPPTARLFMKEAVEFLKQSGSKSSRINEK